MITMFVKYKASLKTLSKERATITRYVAKSNTCGRVRKVETYTRAEPPPRSIAFGEYRQAKDLRVRGL
jgi:hypothetical protein